MPRWQRLVLSPQQVCQGLEVGKVSLTPEQRHYLAHVLRLTGGDSFLAIAQQEQQWWQMCLSADLQWGMISGTVPNLRELTVDVQLAIALPKGAVMDQIIPAVSQLGVSRVIPIYSDRTILQPKHPLSSHKLQRWQRLAEEASELSLRSVVPQICPPVPFAQLITQCTSSHRYIAVTQPAQHLLTLWHKQFATALPAAIDQVTIATGCEGGWTEQEMALAQQNGFVAVSLGDRILSASTAPVVALALINGVIESYAHPAVHPPA
jgi:16S rRNA (uracil1498-N3)-methyltransferase